MPHSAHAPPPSKPPVPLRDRDPSDPVRRAVELAQRGRMVLDVSAADLEAAETVHGPFHPTAWHFRNARDEARRAWDRLRAEFGATALDAALNEPPLTMLVLGGESADTFPVNPAPVASGPRPAPVILIPIAGRTYRAVPVVGTPLAPVQWRLTRLHPPLDDGPYYACRLHDGSTQCDCAGWTYQDAAAGPPAPCKHLAALAALGWL